MAAPEEDDEEVGDLRPPLLPPKLAGFSEYLFTSGLIIHQELLPELSFCTRMKRLCSDRLCLIEFLKKKNSILIFNVIL